MEILLRIKTILSQIKFIPNLIRNIALPLHILQINTSTFQNLIWFKYIYCPSNLLNIVSRKGYREV